MFSAGFHLSPYFARMSFRFKDNIVMVILPTFYLRRKSLWFCNLSPAEKVLIRSAWLTRIRHDLSSLFLLYILGVGPPLSIEHTRMLFALRINILAKGYR